MKFNAFALILGLVVSSTALASQDDAILKCTGEFEGDPLSVTVEQSQYGYLTINYGARTIGGFSVKSAYDSENTHANPILRVSLSLGDELPEGNKTAVFRSPRTGVIIGTEVVCTDLR